MLKRILILDDDEDIAGMMSYLLAKEGFDTVTSFNSGILKDILEVNPSVILLDNRLGDGYGKDYCRQLKEDPLTRHFPVVLISGSDNLERMAAENKADACLQKPFEFNMLMSVVSSLIKE